MRVSLDAVFADADAGPYVPLLLRHIECPGFTGEPMSEPAWRELLLATAALQYPLDS
jgi:hypothetical protein